MRFELRGASYYYSDNNIFKAEFQNALIDFEKAIHIHSTSDGN